MPASAASGASWAAQMIRGIRAPSRSSATANTPERANPAVERELAVDRVAIQFAARI